MHSEPAPQDRLRFFIDQLDLDAGAMSRLEPFCPIFEKHAPAFGREFCDHFFRIERTRLLLEQGDTRARLEKIMAQWFASLFREGFGQRFLTYLWDSGIKHVQLSLDQRFVNLGYAVARGFCHQVIDQDTPLEHREEVAQVVDRMLVATDSFITMTSRCDRSMIEGIAHQVRNPITVIGGNIRRLQNQAPPNSPERRSYDMVLAENQRLERRVSDVAAYTALFQDEPRPEACRLDKALEQARAWVAAQGLWEGLAYDQQLSAKHGLVLADCQELELMLRYLLQNAVEAVDRTNPRVAVSSGPGATPGFARVIISNTGQPPREQDMEDILSPFHSSKPMGTGLGLSIAALAARRNLGSLRLGPSPQGGAACIIDLPAPASD